MSKFKQLESFVAVATRGGLTAAAKVSVRLADNRRLCARLWIDFLKQHYGQAGYWRSQ